MLMKFSIVGLAIDMIGLKMLCGEEWARTCLC